MLTTSLAQASQWGPTFPTHNFPTDRSFHLNTNVEWGSHKSYFNDKAEKIDMTGKFSRLRLILNPEYQPSRQVSIGAFVNFDSINLSGTGQELTKSGLSDQFLYAEYRFADHAGYSLGFATVFKIPLYSVPSSAPTTPTLLLGDGQIDAAFLFTTELWFKRYFRVNWDFGYNFRTDDHASELPMYLGLQYVRPKFNVGLSLNGNISAKNDKTDKDPVSVQIRNFAGAGNYVFAQNPQILKLEVKGEYAFSYAWAANLRMTTALWGNSAPQQTIYNVGASYRFYEPETRRRTYREVEIKTDDTDDVFEGELQEQ